MAEAGWHGLKTKAAGSIATTFAPNAGTLFRLLFDRSKCGELERAKVARR
ncbi:hypothetical protein ACFL5O_11630 [Myxococcota bacterium]